MIKWCYFALVAAFLAAVLWMFNDTRVRVNGLVDRLDNDLTPILKNSEQAAQRINDGLPRILRTSQQAAKDINTHLPQLLRKAQQGIDRLAELGRSFRQFKDLFARLDAPRREKDRGQATNVLRSLIEEQGP